RVHGHGRHEVFHGGSAANGDRQYLDHFAGLLSEYVNSEYPVRLAIHNDLEKRGLAIARYGGLQRPKAGLVDVDSWVLRPRFQLRQANGADLRAGEDRGWHIGVVDLPSFLAEHAVGERVAFADRDGRQVELVRHVTHGVDAWDIRARARVDNDCAVCPSLDSGAVEPEQGRVRGAAEGEQHLVGPQPPPLFGRNVDPSCMVATADVPIASFEAADAVANHQLNATVHVGPGDRLAHVLVKA